MALLAAESQPMCQTRRTRNNDLPMSSGSPILHANHPYGLVRPRRQCGRIKFIPIKVNTARKDETTYRGRASAAQPPVIDSKRAHRVIGPIRQRARIKTEPTNINRTRISGRTYLRHVNVIWPNQRPKKLKGRLDELTLESRIPGET